MTTSSALTPADIDRCPECSTRVRGGDAHRSWCPECEWNLGVPVEAVPTGRRAVRRHRRALREASVLFGALEGRTLRWPDREPARHAASVVTGAVYVLLLASAAAAVGLFAVRPGLFAGLLAASGLACVWVARPRFARPPDGARPLSREAAPTLYALAGRVAADLGVAPPDRIGVTDDLGSRYVAVGAWRRTELLIGLPLWSTLGPAHRVALVALLLGHGAESPLRGPLTMLRRGLRRLSARADQRAAYRVDARAAEIASTAAAADLLDQFLLAVALAYPLRLAARRGERHPQWLGACAGVLTLPEDERERRRRVSVLTGVDRSGTHPPLGLRRRMLLSRPLEPGSVRLPAERSERIDTEMGPEWEIVRREIASWGS